MKKKEQIINIPNIITLFRLLLLPFFIITLIYDKIAIAVLLFGAMAISDALDGLSARIIKQKTNIGALLDGTTDSLVIISTLITVLLIGKYVSAKIIFILLIPAVIFIITRIIYFKKTKSMQHPIMGKITGAFAYITIIAFLINFTYKDIFLIIIIILAYITMLANIIEDVKLFIE